VKPHSLHLEFSDGRPSLDSLADINAALAVIGSRVWPLDLSGAPADIRELIARPTLTPEEKERIQAHFLLPRERLLEVIKGAGREPNVPGGGELTTFVATHNYTYPQLWIVQGEEDYSRFDRFHVNAAEDGTGVDEVLQLLSGGEVVMHHRLGDGTILTLHLACPGSDAGWLSTHDGGKPHIGSLSKAKPGTKGLVQVIGPALWNMTYQA
jgi:hypothetical protein